MRLVLDDLIKEELKEYLLMQEGIIDVSISNINLFKELNIQYNEKTTSGIILRHIRLFQESDYSNLIEFDKDYEGNFKTLEYTIEDICCEYCYKGIVLELFKNKNINSLKSDYNDNKAPFQIHFIIKYNQYKEQELIDYLNKIY